MSLAPASDVDAPGVTDAIAAFRDGRIVRAERLARAVLLRDPDDRRARSLLALLFPDEVAAPVLQPQDLQRPNDAPPIEPDAPRDAVRVADALRRSSRSRARAFLAAHLEQHGDDRAARQQAQLLACEDGDFAAALAPQQGALPTDADKSRKFATNLLRLGLGQQAAIQGELDDDLPNLFLVALARFEDMQPAATRIAADMMARIDQANGWTRLARALTSMQAGDQQDAGFQLAQAAIAAEQQAARGDVHPSLHRFGALLSGWLGSDDLQARAERMRNALDGLPQLARWRGRARRLAPEQVPDWQVAWTMRDDVLACLDAAMAAIAPDEIVLDILPGAGLTSLFAALAGARVFALVSHPGQAAALRNFFDENLGAGAASRVQLLQAGASLDRAVLAGASADWIVAEAAPPCLLHARLFESASYWAQALGSPATRFLPDTIEVEIALARGARRLHATRASSFGPIRFGRLAWSGASLRVGETRDPIVGTPQRLCLPLGTVPPGALLQIGPVGDATHVQLRQVVRYGDTQLEAATLQLAFEPRADAPGQLPAPPDAASVASVLLTPDDVVAFAAPPALPSGNEDPA